MVSVWRCVVVAGFCVLAGWVQATGVDTLVVSEFMASNSTTIADGDGDYSDWIEIYNPDSSAVSLTGCYLTDDPSEPTKWVFPASASISVPASGYLVVFASNKGSDSSPYVDGLGYIHTSFKLSADGESVALVNTDGSTVISSIVSYPEQGVDVSYGIGSGGTTGYLESATPGAANSEAADGWVADTQFDVKRGFYSSPFSVTVTCGTPDATIKYTLDSSSPSETAGSVYSGPIEITGTTVLRVIAYKSGWFSTDIDTQTYIFISDTISQPSTKPGSDWPDPYTGQQKQAMDYGMDTDVTQDSRYADLMDDALLAIPTISLVTDLDNLFDSSTGIYANASQSGEEWERPACVELILPDGSEGFHVNTGLRIRGGTSTAKSNPKHSFRIIMRPEYGDTRIEYPLFGDDGPDKFDKLDFRTAQNFSWNYSSPQYATYLDDPFSRDTTRDMGHVNTNGFFFHLYLDGVYWGLYQIEERPDTRFCKNYLDGDEEDFDVIKADEDNGEIYAVDGNTDLYNAFWDLVNSGVSNNTSYFRLMGQNADGTENASYPKYMDVDNLIDYMLVVFYSGAADMPLGPPNQFSRPRNLYVVANRTEPDGFKYMPHDNEWSLMRQSPGINLNRVSVTLSSTLEQRKYFNPWSLHLQLTDNDEYVLRFADRVHKHFFNGGALTPEACVTRYQARIDEINLAIIAESARWGDYKSSSDPRTRDDDWLPAVEWVRDSFMNASPETRTDIVLSQLISAGLYPQLDAPEFSLHGGTVDSGYALTITADSGTIYYTTDGSDPREIGGDVASAASSGSSGLGVTLNASGTVKARARSGSTWSALTEADFVVQTTGQALTAWASWSIY